MRNLIDIHLHLDGSLPYKTVKKLMKVHEMPIISDRELHHRLSVSPSCQDLDEYLEKFDFPLKLMQTPADLHTCVFDLLQELREQGLVYAEIRFAPQLHTQKGMSQRDAVQAAVAGLNDFEVWQSQFGTPASDLHANLLLCAMRFADNEQENLETVDVAKEFYQKGVTGIDLAGPELGHPNIDYAPVFNKAKKYGIPYTIHAGEGFGIESIKQALAMGAKRIGHGIRCVEDPEFVHELALRGITLECCATSNINTKIFRSLDYYPIRTLLDEKVRVTLNSDNMTVSNTNLPHEYHQLEQRLGLTAREEIQLKLNAINAAFAKPAEKQRLLNLVMSMEVTSPIYARAIY
ncbi:adenosine deaminase [Lactobacillus corticis]|uniref:adenosine deaminase n=1 Tax=Lactobacillus corticis TaxID=2201249 RepID=A0A916QGP8_9LACO|nr:adenosine deaminase [Lactobacillus corticis]GFZ27005.1 adenosine deaminase [Lactobacillus corticis]